MKIKIIAVLAAIVGILGLDGCKPKETTATGQIFIVTRGAENIKLGAVEILLIEKSQVTSFLANKEPSIDAEIASRRHEYEIAEEYQKETSAAYDNRSVGDPTDILDKWVAAEGRQQAAKTNLENSQAAGNYFMGFSPVAIQRTLSDADGRFSFVYPCNKSLTIFASAQRSISNGTEKYYWLIDAPTNAETVQVFLSNNNLVSVDPDDYFKLKPQ